MNRNSIAKPANTHTSAKRNARNWGIILVDLETGDITAMETKLTGPESVELYRRVNRKARRNNAIAILWPDWAPQLKIELGD